MVLKFILMAIMLMTPSLCMEKGFFDTVDDIGRKQRNLLQAEEGSGIGEAEEVATTTTTTTEAPLVLENVAGPTHFYFQNGKLPKFLMKVHEGITVSFFDIIGNVTKEWDTFVLDAPAQGGISGSRINLEKDDFRVNIDYKGHEFTGIKNGEKLERIIIEMNFEKVGGTWRLTDLEIKDFVYKNMLYNVEMQATTDAGYGVSAPAGLAFSCYHPGSFRSIQEPNSTYGATLKFPQVQLQVFEVHRGKFGPEWECGELISIGLWVGILVSLAFATICFWGFSMLASINTMDRFDDPKGKSIYVPQTD